MKLDTLAEQDDDEIDGADEDSDSNESRRFKPLPSVVRWYMISCWLDWMLGLDLWLMRVEITD